MLPLAARTARSVGAALLAALAVAGCGDAGGEGAAADRTEPVPVEAPRRVPGPVAGALSAYVDAGPPAATEPEVLLFGDSVAVLVADDLAGELERPLLVDAVDCRRLDVGFTGPCGGVPDGTVVAPGLASLGPAADRLDDPAAATAVVVMANNAALDAADLDAAMGVLGALPRVWWVNTAVEGRGWRDPNNALLEELAARNPRAGVVDWRAASAGQPWLADHVHPNDAGQRALAGLVADHVRCDCAP